MRFKNKLYLLLALFAIVWVGACDKLVRPQHQQATGPVQQQLPHSESITAEEQPNYILFKDKEVYLNGANIAWFDFARDFGNGVNELRLRAALGELKAAGGNSFRWWLHTDGSATPEWGIEETQGGGETVVVVGPGQRTIADLRKVLDIAAEYEIYIIPCLWSFDMLKDNSYRKTPTQNNFQLLMNDEVLFSYINNALLPMVRELNAHPQLFAWELFNEAENMTEAWFPLQKDFYGGEVPSLERLQRVQALMSAAIHKTAKELGQIALVTTGSKSMGKYNSDVAGGVNLYRDDRMIAAADGDVNAVLDFYAPHYYNNENKDGYWSPFHRHVSFWQVNKAVVIGEFYIEDLKTSQGEHIEAKQLCEKLKENGYAGGWGWQWNQYKKKLIKCINVASTKP